MGTASRYWQLVKLSSNGQPKVEPLPAAETFFKQTFPTLLSGDIPDAIVQRQLWQQRHSQDSNPTRPLAELCLRCFLSHQIEQICIQLENQFGDYYGFTRRDLLPFVLDDDGKVRRQESGVRSREEKESSTDQAVAMGDQAMAKRSVSVANAYQPLALQILSRFDPDRASLTTWTIRLVKQNHALNAFLLERGLCMLSDWAILNDTTQKKLQRVLSQFHHLTTTEVQQASLLLESYHAIYRRDRIMQGQKGLCAIPTTAQLQAIAALLPQPPTLSPAAVLTRLHALADRLRQHRISTRGGLPPTQSLDQPENAALLESLPSTAENPAPTEEQEFLQAYRQQFLTCLEGALEKVIGDRQQTLKPPKDFSFLTGLHLFYCRGLSMTKIAMTLGLKAQFEVSRLLKLKELRSDVRHWMLNCLRQYIFDQTKHEFELDHLNRLDHQIEEALSEQIEALLQADQASSTTPKSYIASNLFAQKVCAHLDHRLPP